jgi:hypothetical protein
MKTNAATLERLSLDDMALKSTAIVRGRVQGCFGEMRGPVIYTHCKVSVSEQWKGTSALVVDVLIPGGSTRGLVQTFSGTPKLTEGDEYVLFLWTGVSRRTQVIGLSQGVFNVKPSSKGELLASREATSERMVDAGGNPVQDGSVEMAVLDLKTRVARILAKSGEPKQ